MIKKGWLVDLPLSLDMLKSAAVVITEVDPIVKTDFSRI